MPENPKPKKPSKADLMGWGLKAERHLKKHDPKTYRELQEAGELYEVLTGIQETAEQMYEQMVAKGVPHEQATEIVERKVVLLPD